MQTDFISYQDSGFDLHIIIHFVIGVYIVAAIINTKIKQTTKAKGEKVCYNGGEMKVPDTSFGYSANIKSIRNSESKEKYIQNC